MKIRTYHQNLGAALIQIAENPNFTAINPLRLRNENIPYAYLINNDTCIFLKYGNEPKETGEYQFTYTEEQILTIDEASEHYNVYIGLICVEEQEICGITADQFWEMIQARRESAGRDEESYQVLVTATPRGQLRVYTNAAGRRGTTALRPIVVPRNKYPDFLFE